MAQKKLPRVATGPLVAYFAAAWFSIALVGYGLALNAFDARKRDLPGVVVSGTIDWRFSWGLGVVGDTCFTLAGNGDGPFCIRQDYLLKGKNHPGNLFFLLTPGTPVSLKAQAGRVVDLVMNPESLERKRPIVEYGNAVGRVQAEVQQGENGTFYILLGLLFVPAVVAFRRFALPRLSSLASGRRAARNP